MSSLYRCKCTVGYRPFDSNNIIAFPERQVAQVSVALKWEANILTLNSQGIDKQTQFAHSLIGSTASVTLSDPYMTGASWAVLFDTAAAYTASDLAASNYIILPTCKKGQNPATNKCRPDTDLEVFDSEREDNFRRGALGSFAHLLIKFYYDVAGVRFGLDTYFRIQGFSITHGKSYPQVQIRGVDPSTVAFNQTLNNIQMQENQTLEENLQTISKSFNHQVSFCTPPDVDYAQEYLMPVAFKEKMVTGEEVIRKYIRSVKGSYLKLPTKEFANKISVCTRANVNQGCSVFYLGKGLYEGYSITGGIERDVLSNNLQGPQLERSLGYEYEEFTPEGKEYTLDDVFPERRKAKLKDVKRLPFPEQFKESDKKYVSNQLSSGFVWKGSGAKVTNERVRKINLYGIGVNGDKAIALLDGSVGLPGLTSKYLNIKTNYFLRICDSGKKCVSRPIYLEVANLTELNVDKPQKITLNQELGTATADKKSFMRFYIPSVTREGSITLDPNLVWNFAQPEEGLTDEEKKKLGIKTTEVRTSPNRYLPAPPSPIVPLAPKKPDKNWSATDAKAKPTRILVMAGHADFASSGRNPRLNTDEAKYNLELLNWVKRNASSYGIQAYLDFYEPPSSSIEDRESPNSQFTQTSRAVAQGKQVIEIHLDEPKGSSGVIPPNKNKGRKIWPLDDRLAMAYGAFRLGFRDNLGIPDRGGTILEVGVMDSATVNIFKRGTAEQKEALYRQLMDPFMRAVSAEVQRAGQFVTPAGSQPQPSTSNRVCFKMGNSGSSTGPHLHAEWGDGRTGSRPITAEDVRKYISVEGVVTSSYGPRSSPGGKGSTNHRGVDIANNIGTPICLNPGVTVNDIANPGCPNNGRACGPGSYGNSVVVNTPEGPMLLAHLSPDSDFSGAGSPAVNNPGADTNPGSKYGDGVQAAPSPVGVTIETEFNGIPRALRIVPGRTILYFISEYDAWVEDGRRKDLDPGVWIPDRFSRWFISEANYLWTKGDLRVKLTGVSDWGASTGGARIKAPSWKKYLSTQGFKETKDYYGYIRSLGDLCWNLSDGRTSCEVECAEAENIRAFLQKGNDPASFPQAPDLTPPSSVTSSFPTARCRYVGSKYPRDRVQGIINAARQAGITSKAGFAGVVGNAIVESFDRLDPRAKNNNTKYGFDGCVGIFQWCDRRAGLRKFVQSRGKPVSAEFDFNEQMAFFVAELTPGSGFTDDVSIVAILNSQTDPSSAAFQFNSKYERAVGQKDPERQAAAREIFSDLDCQ